MVTRKSLAPLSTSSKDQNPNPPYPTTPTAHPRSPGFTELDRTKTIHSLNSVYSPNLNTSPAFDLIDMNEARQRPRRDSDVSSHGTWDSEDEGERDGTPEEDTLDVPKPLRISKSQEGLGVQVEGKGKGRAEDLPASLRPGGLQPRKSQEALGYEDEASGNSWASPTEGNAPPSSQPVSYNPYRQQHQNVAGPQTSQSAWQPAQPTTPAPPANAPPAPPVELSTALKTPSDELQHMSLGGQSQQHQQRPEARPFETAEILAVPQQGRPLLASVVEQNQQENRALHSNNPWRTPSQERTDEQQTLSGPPPPQSPPAVQSPPYPNDEALGQHSHQEEFAPPPGQTNPQQQYPPPPSHGQQYAPPPGLPPKARASTSLIDHEEPPSHAMPSEQSRPQPPPVSTAQPLPARSAEAVPETPGTKSKRQRSEHYQIKHINWYDANSGMRRSPILTQNANGPCPLLALVNALVLTTPQNLDTALIETLRTREQVSLGLLLDAVFDELMSGRRGDTASELPDVGELYAFLLALHTGMNVNPRFITPVTAPRGSLDMAPPEKGVLHPAERAQTKAGCFEETKEMRLYSTFNVPLIHGWTAPAGTPAYQAFARQAGTFEEAQNIQFLESELEDKLQSEGLVSGEQQMLQDIQTIKSFLATWSTQLTDYGLETISASLRPGQTAILFRNDHFSTLYKESKHGALMTLVTDAGYGSHDEIVWESLVDVNGAASEMFSGDFRTVSHGQDARLNQGSSAGGEEGWEIVQGRNRNSRQSNQQSTVNAPPLPGPRPQHTDASHTLAAGTEALSIAPEQQRKTSEQQDHDLALALQLQEEEEDQQRQADQRRRREQELSERFLSTESTSPTSPEGPRPPIPPRRSNNNTGSTRYRAPSGPRPGVSAAPSGGRPAVTRPAGGDDPEAPPSYEQSRSDRRYTPAGATAQPGIQQGNPLNAYNALRRQQQQPNTPPASNGPTSPVGRRHSQVPLVNAASNRVRRQSSHMAAPSGAMPGTYGSGSMYHQGQPGQQAGRPNNQAAGVKDAEDKCTLM